MREIYITISEEGILFFETTQDLEAARAVVKITDSRRNDYIMQNYER